MRNSLQRIVSDFQSQMETVKRQLALFDYLVRGSPTLTGLVISETQSRNMAIIARAMNTYISNEMRVAIQNGSIIIGAAFFEESIRAIVRDCLVVMAHKKKHFHELGRSVQKSQIASFGTKFVELKNPDELFQVEFITQIENMLTCARKAQGYVLLSAEISKNKNNMRSAELTDLCNRIGVSGIWEKLAQKKPLQDYIGQYNPKFVLSEATNRLNAFIEIRNGLMHLNPIASSYGTPWIEAELDFLSAVTMCTASVIDDHLRRL